MNAAPEPSAEVPAAESDNHSIEHALRSVVMGRRSWLHVGQEVGGERAAHLFSLTISCHRLGVAPYAYLCDIIPRLPRHPHRDIWQLTPRGWKETFGPKPSQSPSANKPPPRFPSSYLSNEVNTSLPDGYAAIRQDRLLKTPGLVPYAAPLLIAAAEPIAAPGASHPHLPKAHSSPPTPRRRTDLKTYFPDRTRTIGHCSAHFIA